MKFKLIEKIYYDEKTHQEKSLYCVKVKFHLLGPWFAPKYPLGSGSATLTEQKHLWDWTYNKNSAIENARLCVVNYLELEKQLNEYPKYKTTKIDVEL